MLSTLASLILGIGVYDTQCVAKLFFDTPAFREALEQPFGSRGSFDGELIGRLLTG
ncbi:MAG: hypothetical protein JST54_03765 [Deltaproteobacteria bacterium]|nr:hypothetical protein [Deltaproteobacteria bacterium]